MLIKAQAQPRCSIRHTHTDVLLSSNPVYTVAVPKPNVGASALSVATNFFMQRTINYFGVHASGHSGLMVLAHGPSRGSARFVAVLLVI